MNSKRVLIYIESMEPAGGIERVVSDIVWALNNEFKFDILVKGNKVSYYPLPKSVDFYSLDSKKTANMRGRLSRFIVIFLGLLIIPRKLSGFIGRGEYDYVYVAHPKSVLEYFLAGLSKSQLVISEHGAISNYNFVYKLLKRLLYKKSYRYCVPTTGDAALYKEKGLPVVYIPHFKPDLEYEKANSSNKQVLNIGRFTADKDQVRLLKIWKELFDEGLLLDGWHLKIVGSGELESNLKEYVQLNNLDEVVVFQEPVSDVSELYLSSSIFALTSRSEGFGMVLLEAMSFGLPCISFSCSSGPRDLIEDGKTGFLCDLFDDAAYKDRLLALMEDQSMREWFSTNSLKKSFGWSKEVIIKKWKEVFV